MNLVDDYLRAVALLLPKDKRDDIIDELRELILSRIESREAELGRKLTDDETEEVLRQLGHPLVVASRYRDGPQHLVGPAIYPYWMFAVKAAVTIQLALAAVVFLVRILTGDIARAGNALSGGFTGSLILIGIAVIVAWMIDRQALRIHTFEKWRVRDLRFLSFAAWDADAWSEWLHSRSDGPRPRRDQEAPSPRPAAASPSPSAPESTTSSQTASRDGAAPPGPGPRDLYDWGRRGRRLPRKLYGDAYGARYWRGYRGGSPVGRGLGGIAAGVVLLLWWVGAVHVGIAGSVDDFRTLGIEPGALATADWAGVKAALYLPVLAYVGLLVTKGAVRIVHPEVRRIHGLIDIAIAVVMLFTIGWLWNLSPIASAVRVETVAGFAQRMRDLFQDGPPFALAPGLTLLLVVLGFGAVIKVVGGVVKVLLPEPRPWPPYAMWGAA